MKAGAGASRPLWRVKERRVRLTGNVLDMGSAITSKGLEKDTVIVSGNTAARRVSSRLGSVQFALFLGSHTEPLSPRVHIEATVPQKADQRLPAIESKAHGQARGR